MALSAQEWANPMITHFLKPYQIASKMFNDIVDATGGREIEPNRWQLDLRRTARAANSLIDGHIQSVLAARYNLIRRSEGLAVADEYAQILKKAGFVLMWDHLGDK